MQKKKSLILSAVTSTVLVVLLGVVASAEQPKNDVDGKFTTINVPNEAQTTIYGISNSGVMVGTYLDNNLPVPNNHGFVRTPDGKFTTADDLNGQNTILAGISPNGSYIVGCYFNTGVTTSYQGFIVKNRRFVNVIPTGSTSSCANGVNDSGNIVGRFVDVNGNNHGYYWDGTKYTDLDVPNSTNTSALGINNSKTITLYWQDSSFIVRGAVYSGGQYQTVNVPNAVPWGIDSAGDIVFDWDWNIKDPPSHGALRTAAGKFYFFDDPSGVGYTQPHGINDKHVIVGGFGVHVFGAEKVLYNFCSQSSCADGASPEAGLIQDASGNLYGTTHAGGNYNTICGTSGCGTAFKLDNVGHETLLYTFCSNANCTDGAQPWYAGLLMDAAGRFYGTTYLGGAYSLGTAFKIEAPGIEGVLHSFGSANDGQKPEAGLIQDASGNLYGTTSTGGILGNHGTLFELDSVGNEIFLHNFSYGVYQGGWSPESTPIRDNFGNLYGTNTGGGANGVGGTVYKLDPAGNETVLYSFCSQPNCADGEGPVAGLIRDAAGNLYGTTHNGGAYGDFWDGGTVFKVDNTGQHTVLYSFCSQPNCADGEQPLNGGVIQDVDGSLYGTTVLGGAHNAGTVFKLDPSGQETVLYSFCAQANCLDGLFPEGGVIQDAAGNLYGTTRAGGSNGLGDGASGTVFEITGSIPFSGFALQY